MASPILILDGGLGTSLEQKYNCKFDKSTPLWSSDLLVSDPDTLRRCQADFGRVPVDILLTATYQVSLEGFAGTRGPDGRGIGPAQIPRYLEEAVRIGEAAAARDVHHGDGGRIALSIGPYGACMVPSQEYSGAYDADHSTAEALYAWHGERMRLFASSVADVQDRLAYVALETIPRVDEITAMRRALAGVPALSSLPFWMSCLFPGDGGQLPDGTSVEAALAAMLDPSVEGPACWGVGINCTKVHKLDGLLRRYEGAVGEMVKRGVVKAWPALVLYPDGTNGEVYNTETQLWELPKGEEGSPERAPWAKQLAEMVRGTQERGQWSQIVVGGCCMAGSEDIATLRRELV